MRPATWIRARSRRCVGGCSFFFSSRRRHTRWNCDWSSDVCSSDLVITGGEPMLQLDEPLVEALHQRGFRIAAETNGTLPATAGIDWVCVSPKAGTDVVQRSGDELKLVWPQPGIEPAELESWQFDHFLVQPMDCEERDEAIQAAIELAMERPKWRLTLQAHKVVGLA